MPYLTVLDVIAMHDELIERTGGAVGLRDEGALDSAIMRPQMAAYYEEADLVTQAVLLMSGIALAHAFVDGNKRTALASGLFLQVKDFKPLSRAFLQLLSKHDSCYVVRTHEAHGVATGLCGRDGLV